MIAISEKKSRSITRDDPGLFNCVRSLVFCNEKKSPPHQAVRLKLGGDGGQERGEPGRVDRGAFDFAAESATLEASIGAGWVG